MFKKMKLFHTLLTAFLLVGTLPLVAVGITIHLKTSEALSQQSFSGLTALRAIKGDQVTHYFTGLGKDLQSLAGAMSVFHDETQKSFLTLRATKKGELEGFFRQLQDDLSLFSEVTEVREFYRTLVNFHNETGVSDDGAFQVDSDAYRKIYREHGEKVLRLAERYGFEEVLMICAAHGHVMFSKERRDDMGTNLRFGPYKESVLQRLWKKVAESGKEAIVDFEPYGANGGRPTAFLGAPLRVDGKLQGVIAVQVPLAEINRIMGALKGLGKGGETYLVGPDLLMRSDSHLDPANHTVAASFANPTQGRVDTSAVKAAFKEGPGIGITRNYLGKEVVSVWTPVTFLDLTWAFLTEVGVEEAFNPKNADGKEYLHQFQELNDLYDALLIDGAGFVFYSTAKGAEYQTNLLTGPYRNSNLGRLVAQVIKGGDGGFTDFEPYAPAGNKPAAFLAQPVKVGERVEMVAAVQISPKDINLLMQQREGLGETGEAYLVGPDKRMRSDSYLDGQNRSIQASFAGTLERNGVDTEAAREALEGRSGTRIIKDYRGNAALSSYAPLKIGPYTWAVIAEESESEALGTVHRLSWLIGLILLLAVAAIVGVALWLARSITRPVTDAVTLSAAVSDGRLDLDLTSERSDEVGQLIASLGAMSARLREIVGQVRVATDQVVTAAGEISKGNMDLSQRTEEQASSLEETAASMEELTSTVKQNAENAVQANRLAADARRQAEDGGGVAGRAMQAMTAINDSSKRIADIIGVIDEIAFQTNLLSLNAAVEAARAGEHGRGFAVVADEVRKLAQRSADAAKEIKSLITDSVHKVEEGSRLVDESGRALSEIIAAVKQVSDIVAEITAASREQSVGIEQVNKAVVQMDEVTQQNASLVEEAAAAAASLEEQAKRLQRSMAFFKLGEREEAPQSRPRAHLPPPPMAKVAERSTGSPRHVKGAATHSEEWEEF